MGSSSLTSLVAIDSNCAQGHVLQPGRETGREPLWLRILRSLAVSMQAESARHNNPDVKSV